MGLILYTGLAALLVWGFVDYIENDYNRTHNKRRR